MRRWNFCVGTFAVGLAGLLLVAVGQAQEEAGEQIRLPAEQPMVEVRVQYPDSIRVGESFRYKVMVKNTTDSVLLNQVTIRQELPKGLEIENSKPSMSGDQQQQEGHDQGRQEDQGQQKGQGQMAHWVIKDLKPGETKTIEVQATTDQKGELRTCMAISYTPALCLTAKVIQPEVNVVKAVPDAAGICELLLFRYRVENTGTGTTDPLVLVDELPEALRTRDGEQAVRIPIDPLAAGESKVVEAQVVATRTGEFGSRATVRDREDNEQVARSQRATTRIERPELTLDIQGPQVQYVGQPATYTVVVTNVGQTKARDGRLLFQFEPRIARLVNRGEPKFTTEEQPQQGAQGQEEAGQQQPAEAPQAQEAQPQQQAAQAQRDEDEEDEDEQQMRTLSWELDDLEPGESGRVQVTLVGSEQGTLKTQAVANFECALAADYIDTKTTTTLSTDVIALPALLIGVIDEQDPVEVGEEYVYELVVANEGAAPDQNIQVEVQMPEQLEFVEGSGATKVTGQNGGVKIAPLDQLAAGDEVRWRLRVRAKSAGDIRFRIRVTSDYLTSPATAEEPTRLFSTDGGGQAGEPQAKGKPAGKEEAEGTPTVRPNGQE